MEFIIRLWAMLLQSAGTLALIGVVIALLAGRIRALIDKLGTSPVLVLLTIGGIVIAGWAVRYVPRLAAVRAQPQIVAAKKAPTPVKQKAHRRRRYVQRPFY